GIGARLRSVDAVLGDVRLQEARRLDSVSEVERALERSAPVGIELVPVEVRHVAVPRAVPVESEAAPDLARFDLRVVDLRPAVRLPEPRAALEERTEPLIAVAEACVDVRAPLRAVVAELRVRVDVVV